MTYIASQMILRFLLRLLQRKHHLLHPKVRSLLRVHLENTKPYLFAPLLVLVLVRSLLDRILSQIPPRTILQHHTRRPRTDARSLWQASHVDIPSLLSAAFPAKATSP